MDSMSDSSSQTGVLCSRLVFFASLFDRLLDITYVSSSFNHS